MSGRSWELSLVGITGIEGYTQLCPVSVKSHLCFHAKAVNIGLHTGGFVCLKCAFGWPQC